MTRIMVAAVLAASTTFVHAQSEDKVFMFVRDGSRDLPLMLEQEVGVMKQKLEAAGYTVDIATASGEPLGEGDAKIVPTVELHDVDVASYRGVALPCMAPAEGHPLPEEVTRIVRDAVAAEKPIAAARGSVVAVAKAEGLVGKSYAFAAKVDSTKRTEFQGGEFVGTGVVRDGNVNTSGICPLAAKSTGLPDGTVALTDNFIATLNEAQ